MTVQRALIVDDSRTAQHRLKRYLQDYKLEVDTATSAEEALGYLSYKIPSVIFMDHHMEGMDGLEALKIIKANPSTATIPVIMYTSRSDSDDVYAGQAHALGALDTLSKSVMKPAKVEEALAKLNIFPGQEIQQRPQADEQADNQEQSAQAPQAETRTPRANSGELKAQIARLFELHIADVRTQITEHTKFIVRRLANEIKNGREQTERVNDVPLSVIDEHQEENTKVGKVSNVLLGLILVALTGIAFQLILSHKRDAKLEDDLAQITNISHQTSLLLDDVVMASRGAELNSEKAKIPALLDTIAWATQIDMRFGYGNEALGEQQVLNLQNLVFRLTEAGFKGFIELNIQLGNFCVEPTEDGLWKLAAPNTPVTQCAFLRDQKVELSAEKYTSVAYLQFEQTSVPVVKGDIEFLINVSAFDDPIYPYPRVRENVTAAEWNAVAAQNQQVLLVLEASN